MLSVYNKAKKVYKIEGMKYDITPSVSTKLGQNF